MKKLNVKKSLLGLTMAAVMLAGTAPLSAMATLAEQQEAIKPTFGNYYSSDYDTREETMEASFELNERIAGEGIVMLKNEDNALPINEGSKISVFGKNSAYFLSGGGGSGAGGGAPVTSLYDALQQEGFEINTKLMNFYRDASLSGAGRGATPGIGATVPGYNTGETPISSYTSDIEATYENYSDAALVVFSRIGGEGFDLPRTMMWNGSNYYTWNSDATQLVPGARAKDDHYLQLDQNESDLLKYLGDRFEKVIVLLNTGSQFEVGFLDDPGHYGYHENIKAALHVGYSGMNGTVAIAKILKGEVNPSGKTVDTWARDYKKDPTWQNMGNYLMEAGPSNKGNQYENLPGSGGNGGGGYRNNYVIYQEGIYMGYRYYETRNIYESQSAYSDGTIHGTTTSAWDSWYKAHVTHPFGYGLSYTQFKMELVDQSPSENSTLGLDDVITVKVKVTNTGNVAGKEVVQIYYTAPYSVEEAPIEKAHVVLGAYEKTELLQPNESQTLVLQLKVRDMASYDWNDLNKNDFKGYEVEAGKYQIKVMRDAHTEVDAVEYNVAEDIKVETSAETGNKIENRFDDVSNYLLNDIIKDGEKLNEVYMSRSDFEGTFPNWLERLTAPEWVVEGLGKWVDNKYETYEEDDPSDPWYSDVMPTTGAKNGLKLQDLVGIDYDDERWSLFMDQLTVDQLVALCGHGHYGTGQNYPELGIVGVRSSDGPAGWFFAVSGIYSSWVNDVILASTWNKDLAYEKGRAMGNEGLWGSGAAGDKNPYWYAPACNIHRSPFSGRNFEYYSEDGYLSGMMAAYVIKGGLDKGMISYVKHFGVNDQETNRCGLVTWANEQSIREIYIKSFELCVTVGKTKGMMSALNKLGPNWVGSHWGLLTGILREEWGFIGCVVTDSYSEGWSNADLMVRAGGNLALGSGRAEWKLDTPTTVTALRKMAGELLYSLANSMGMNKSAYPAPPKALNTYDSATLKAAVMNANYTASVATAEINKEMHPDATAEDVKYALAEGSVLPEGLTLAENGIITGTPTEEVSNYKFSVTATFKDCTRTAEFILNVVNSSGSIIYAGNHNLNYAIVNEPVEYALNTAYIYKPDASQEEISKYPEISYSLKNASLLPEGLALSKDGVISGTPTKEGENYTFTVVASAMGYKDKEITYTLNIYKELIFNGKKLAQAKYGVSYLETVSFATCENEVTYTLKQGSVLPAGLTLTEGGYIVGTPTETLTNHTFTVIASAPLTAAQEAVYTISVGLSFNDFTLMDAKVGEAYEGTVKMAQGARNITYSFKEDSEIPEGITLSTDGTLTGTPTVAGVYDMTIVASADGLIGEEFTVTLFVEGAQAGGCAGSGSSTLLSIAAAILACGALLVTQTVRRRKTGESQKI